MSHRAHPMARLVAPLAVVKAETWTECTGQCNLRWRVTLQNYEGDERTQSGTVYGTPPKDNSGWFEFWRAVADAMTRYRLELLWTPLVYTLPLKRLYDILDITRKEDLYLYRDRLGDVYERMQNLTEAEWVVVQYLCEIRVQNSK